MRRTRLFAAALILVALLQLCACSSPQKMLIGTWKSSTSLLGVSVESEYTFLEDGTGNLSTVLGLGMPFTYTLAGNELIVAFETFGVTTTQKYDIEFKDDTLTLTGDQLEIVLTKK